MVTVIRWLPLLQLPGRESLRNQAGHDSSRGTRVIAAFLFSASFVGKETPTPRRKPALTPVNAERHVRR
jgi:hypothetical protein